MAFVLVQHLDPTHKSILTDLIRTFTRMNVMEVEDGVENLLEDWKKCLEAGGTWDHKFSIRDKSGKERIVLARGVPVKDERGQVTSWVGVNLDMTETADRTTSCDSGPAGRSMPSV